MKRWTISLATLAVIWLSAPLASAVENNNTKSHFCPNARPIRSRLESVGVWVKTNGPGYPAYRYTYRGASDGFPPPAWLYYGYPHSGDGSGIGF